MEIGRITFVPPFFGGFPLFSPIFFMQIRLSRRGFTLIELLLVIGIIAILAAIVIVAINPTKQLGQARNAQRRSDVNTILNAVYQYSIDHNGSMPGSLSATATDICRTTGTPVCTGLVDLSVLTSSYVVAMPVDPQAPDANTTGYQISQDATSQRITVTAPLAEQSETISVTR
jgi:type IV pilus assembly protein PilA